MSGNPLLGSSWLPAFDQIRAAHVQPAIERLVADNLQAIETLVANPEPSWDNLVAPLEALNDRLERAWAPVSHLNAVVQTEELRQAHDACLPLLSDYSTKLGQHQGLYQAYQRLRDSEAFAPLNAAQQKTIDNALRDFRLSGIALPEAEQQRYAEIASRLSELASQFSNNVLDATRSWTKHITDQTELAGLPDSALSMLAAQAAARHLEGWLITLDAPVYMAVMMDCDNRALREELYEAYTTRASEQGPAAGRFDNSALMTEILALRHEMAELLGFANYAELSLATKMADAPEQVEQFLSRLAAKSKPFAERDRAAMDDYAAKLGISELASWDVAYVSEKMRREFYAVDQEALLPYFPADKVMNGLFKVIERLFGVQIEQAQDVALWHQDAQAFYVTRDGQRIAAFITDLYAREGKRGGAWMADLRARRQTADGLQLPAAFLTCNFRAPTADRPSLLTFDDVTTLFHEFGHGLHHMLTEVDCASVSGIAGVEWDAVELPSQFLENWCWDAEVIGWISGHYQTGESLPREQLEKLLAAKNFQSGWQMVRQLEFSLFDWRLHWHYQAGIDVQQVLDQVRAEVAVMIPPASNRFQHSFSHIFAGGYAAGYYSYKWAEVLSADAFAAFEETSLFDQQTSERFLAEILTRGGVRSAADNFAAFRGRASNEDALMRHSGLVEGAA